MAPPVAKEAAGLVGWRGPEVEVATEAAAGSVEWRGSEVEAKATQCSRRKAPAAAIPAGPREELEGLWVEAAQAEEKVEAARVVAKVAVMAAARAVAQVAAREEAEKEGKLVMVAASLATQRGHLADGGARVRWGAVKVGGARVEAKVVGGTAALAKEVEGWERVAVATATAVEVMGQAGAAKVEVVAAMRRSHRKRPRMREAVAEMVAA